jgi:uncharacterized protein (UPF0548 family)
VVEVEAGPVPRDDERVAATLLDPVRAAELQAAGYTYREVGQSQYVLPAGYSTLTRSTVLKTGDLDAAGAALFGWEVQLRSGIRVEASAIRVAPGAVVVMRVGLGRLSVLAPCRVVYVIEEPDRRGFGYGTLPGHPESGEESFLLERLGNGEVVFTITAFSRPASTLAKLSGPASRAVQRAMTARYLRALDPA